MNQPGTRFCQFCGAPMQGGAPAGPGYQPAQPPAGQGYGAYGAHGHGHGGAPATSPEPRYAPGSQPAARLVVITQDGTPGRRYELNETQTDIGREEGAILLPNDPYVSPRHARLFLQNGRFFVRDLGSLNGVYVRLRKPERLQNGDLVLIGLEVLRFEFVSDAEKSLGATVERGTQLFGSPATTRHARLLQRTVEGVTRDVYTLTRDETVIGREAGDIVFTSDPFMSRQHTAIRREGSDNSFTIRDLGSSNGTYLGIRNEVALDAGDHIRIGQHLFRLEVEQAG